MSESNMPPLPDISKLSKPLQLAFEEYSRAYAEQQTAELRKQLAELAGIELDSGEYKLRAEKAEQQTAEAEDQMKWASHYAKRAALLEETLRSLVEAYRNKHSPQHRASCMTEALTVLEQTT